MEELPELPRPAAYCWPELEDRYSSAPPMHVPMGLVKLHTEEAMREYTRKAVLLERERCFKLVDALEDRLSSESWRLQAWAAEVAAAIRSSGGSSGS